MGSVEINGWTPPLIHSDYEGKSHVATQAEVDALVKAAAAYPGLVARLRQLIRDLETE